MTQQQITKLYNLLMRENCCGTNAKTFFEKRFFTTKFNKSYTSVRDYLLYATPLFAVRFFADYKKFSNKEREFWMRFNDSWVSECKRNKWIACDGLEDYKGQEPKLLNRIDEIFTINGRNVQSTDVCHDVDSTVNLLIDLLYEDLKREEDEKQKVIEEQHRKIQEAQEAGRRRMEEEAKAKASLEKEEEQEELNPIYTMGIESSDIDSIFSKGDISDIFEKRLRNASENEARVLIDYDRKCYKITFGASITNQIMESGFYYFHFFEDMVGNYYIYLDGKPGIKTVYHKNRITLNSKQVCEKILNMFGEKERIFFTLELRETNNPDIIVFQISNISKK